MVLESEDIVKNIVNTLFKSKIQNLSAMKKSWVIV